MSIADSQVLRNRHPGSNQWGIRALPFIDSSPPPPGFMVILFFRVTLTPEWIRRNVSVIKYRYMSNKQMFDLEFFVCTERFDLIRFQSLFLAPIPPSGT